MNIQQNLTRQDVVLVTGASSGIGLSTCKLLRARDYRVFGSVRNSEDAQFLHDKGIEPLLFDIRDFEAVGAAIGQVEHLLSAGYNSFSLVNNSGIAVNGPGVYVEIEEWRKQIEINFLGAVHVTQKCFQLLRRGRRPGRIINISSISGRIAFPFFGPYASSKFALEAFTASLRTELIPFGIRVISIQPGAVRTPIWDKADSSLLSGFKSTEYGPLMERLVPGIIKQGKRGLDPSVIAAKILLALTKRKPRFRYLITPNALRNRLILLLPQRWCDFLFNRMMGISKLKV